MATQKTRARRPGRANDSGREPILRVLDQLCAGAAQLVTERAQQLQVAQERLAALDAARASGTIDALIQNAGTPAEVLEGLGPHMTVNQISSVLRCRSADTAEPVVVACINHAAIHQPTAVPGLAAAVGATLTWNSVRRVRLLTDQIDPSAAGVVTAALAQDPRLAVLVGLTTAGQAAAWTHLEGVRAACKVIGRGPRRHEYELGCAFGPSVADTELEWDLINLLASSPDPELAARLVAQMPPLPSRKPAMIAKRLFDLDILVDAVRQQAP